MVQEKSIEEYVSRVKRARKSGWQQTHLELTFRLDIFGEVGSDGFVELVENTHGEHRIDVSGLDKFV